MLLGAHVGIGSELSNALDSATAIGCEVMQIFTSNPKGWTYKIRSDDEIFRFCQNKENSKIKAVYGHAIYLTNLASANPYIYTNSINSLISGIVLAERARLDGVITHIGSHGGAGEEEGTAKVVNALKQILKATHGDRVPIILETDAGSGNHLGKNFSQIGKIIDKVNSNRIKVCLDTCHIYAAGYNIARTDGLEDALLEFDREIGLDRLLVMHLNDSRGELGSNLDRHAVIGEGKIGLNAFGAIINHPKLKNLHGIVETPDNKTLLDEKHSIDILKELRKK